MTNDEKEIINVDANARDRIVSLGKGLAGLAPVVGPLVAEVVDNLIPNQRIDRISRLVKALEARLE